jgi:hypothetical protein
VKVLVREPTRKTVSWVTGVLEAMSATPVVVEELGGSVADHAHGHADGRVAAEDLADPGLQPERIDSKGPAIRSPDRRLGQ